MAVTKSIEINAPPDRVWQLLADPNRWSQWMGRFKKTEQIEGSDAQPGAKVRVYWTETTRDREYGKQSREREATWVIQAVEPGSMIQMGQPPNFTTWRLYSLPTGTRVDMEAEFNSFAAKLFGPITKMFAGAQGNFDLKSLKKNIEAPDS